MITPTEITNIKKEGLKPLRTSFYTSDEIIMRVALKFSNPSVKSDDPLFSSGQPLETYMLDCAIGELLITYLDYNFNSFEDFRTFNNLFGISCLVEHSVTASNLKSEENIQIAYTESEYNELLKVIWNESKEKLSDIQSKFMQLISICLVDGSDTSWTHNIGIQERTYIYLLRNKKIAEWLRSAKYKSDIFNLDYLVDGTNNSLNTDFIENIRFSNEKQLGNIIEQFSESANMIFYEDYYTYDIISVLALTFWKMVLQNKPLKICKACGKLFIPLNRSDEEYCSRISTMGKTCRQVGASRTYMRNKSVVAKLYITRYKGLNARKRSTSGYKLNRNEFKRWQQLAYQKLIIIEKQYENASTPEERESIYSEFKEWLYDESLIDSIKKQLRE